VPHEALVGIIEQRTEGVRDWPTPIPNLGFWRREKPEPPAICMVAPSVVLVAQGTKKMWVGDQCYEYDTDRLLITSLDLPANSEVVTASPQKPCLGLVLNLDLRLLADLISQGSLPPPMEKPGDRGMGIGTVTPHIIEAFRRLLDLLDEPEAIPVLAPLIQREIHYRLLMSNQAALLQRIVAVGSQSQRVAKAIDWLKVNYASPLRIDDLASRVQMSASSLHHHFRKLTAMSPLQYQKWMRLNEAKRLMLNDAFDATSAAFQVGYESPSQFNREYSRMFGQAPKRDIVALRGEVAVRVPAGGVRSLRRAD